MIRVNQLFLWTLTSFISRCLLCVKLRINFSFLPLIGRYEMNLGMSYNKCTWRIFLGGCSLKSKCFGYKDGFWRD